MYCRTLSRLQAGPSQVELTIIKQRQFDLPTEIVKVRLFEEQSRRSLPVCELTVLAQRHHVARRVGDCLQYTVVFGWQWSAQTLRDSLRSAFYPSTVGVYIEGSSQR